MKINKMWAMFDKDGAFFPFSIKSTRRGIIKTVDWRRLYRRGYRIKKVVVLPVDRAGNFLPKGSIKVAREEVLNWLVNWLAAHCTGQPEGLVADILQAYEEQFRVLP